MQSAGIPTATLPRRSIDLFHRVTLNAVSSLRLDAERLAKHSTQSVERVLLQTVQNLPRLVYDQRPLVRRPFFHVNRRRVDVAQPQQPTAFL